MAQAQTKAKQEQASDIPTVRSEEESAIAVINPDELKAAHEALGALKDADQEMMQTFINWLVERASGSDEDTFAVMASIMRDILDGDSAEEVLRERQTLSAKNIPNVPLILHQFEIREGQYEDSLFGYYAAMTVSRPGLDGTRIVCCGANKVLMKLYALDRIGEWPQVFWFKVRDGKKGVIIDMVRE